MERYLGLPPLLCKVRVPQTHMNIAWPAAQVASSGFCSQTDPGLRPASNCGRAHPGTLSWSPAASEGVGGLENPRPGWPSLSRRLAEVTPHPPSSFVRVLPWPCRGCQGQQNSLAPSPPSLLSRWVLTPSLTPKKQTRHCCWEGSSLTSVP